MCLDCAFWVLVHPAQTNRVVLVCSERPTCAQVQDVHMLTHQDTGKLRGCFVAFATPEEVGLAVSRDGSVSCS